MKIVHTASVSVPYQPTVFDLQNAMMALDKVPADAKVEITSTSRSFDQRDNTSWGGETTFRVRWED